MNDKGKLDADCALYYTGETICVGDRIRTYGPNDAVCFGNVLMVFRSGDADPRAKDWNMEDGGVLVELDRGDLMGFPLADEELFLVSRKEI